jgi:tetratricopeptide (TPR) repeat protein
MTQTTLFQEGFAALKSGRYADARRLFAENEKAAGTAVASVKLLREAEAALAQGTLDVAANKYQQVLDRNPSLTEAYVGLCRIGLFTKQLESAKVHATAATKLGPEVGMSWTMLGLVAEAEGQLEEAISLLKRGAELSPSNVLCQLNYGRLLAAVNRGAEAIGPLKQAALLEPNNKLVFQALGAAHVQCNQFERAIAALETAKELDPTDVEAYATLVDTLFRVKEFRAALTLADQGLGRCGEHPLLLEKAVACAMMLSDPQKAVEYVKRELKVAPDHQQAHVNLANLLVLTGDLEEAELVAKGLVEKCPGNWEGWFSLGNLYEAAKRDALAEAAYQKACEAAPQDEWRPLANLGILRIEMKRGDEAAQVLESAMRIAPQAWQPVYNLALAQVLRGKREQAAALADRLLPMSPRQCDKRRC